MSPSLGSLWENNTPETEIGFLRREPVKWTSSGSDGGGWEGNYSQCRETSRGDVVTVEQ